MKKFLSTLLLVLVISTVALAKGQSATVVFTVSPQMTCQNCENKIKTNIRFEKGVTAIATDIPSQTVKITYDPAKTSPEKLTAAFKKIGYTATVTTPAGKKAEGEQKK